MAHIQNNWAPALCGRFLNLGPWPQLLLVASGSDERIRRSKDNSTPEVEIRQSKRATVLA